MKSICMKTRSYGIRKQRCMLIQYIILSKTYDIVYTSYGVSCGLPDLSEWANGIASFQWTHFMSNIINSLISAGLIIEFIHEFLYCVYDNYRFIKKHKKGWWHFKECRCRNSIDIFIAC